MRSVRYAIWWTLGIDFLEFKAERDKSNVRILEYSPLGGVDLRAALIFALRILVFPARHPPPVALGFFFL